MNKKIISLFITLAILISQFQISYALAPSLVSAGPRIDKVIGDRIPKRTVESIDNAVRPYGLKFNRSKFTQIAGPAKSQLPGADREAMISLISANMAALSAYFDAGCGIGFSKEAAKERKAIADGGAVTMLENMIESFANAFNITIIIGGSEGAIRDNAPALRVKQVVNPNGANGTYIIHADPIENTNSMARNQPGAWAMLFAIKLPQANEVMLRLDYSEAKKHNRALTLEEFLESKMGAMLAKYGILFGHDRYAISISYPGNSDAPSDKIAKFNPADEDLKKIFQSIAEEIGISEKELYETTHFVCLDRKRHTYIADYLNDVGAAYSHPEDGDAFVRVAALLGIPTHSGRQRTIVLGASGGQEGFVVGSVVAGLLSSDGRSIGRIRMIHSSTNLKGNSLAGHDNFSADDMKDFYELGLIDDINDSTGRLRLVEQEGSLAGYDRATVFTSITGSRPDMDISADIPVPAVSVGSDGITLTSIIVDKYGRSYSVVTTYDLQSTAEYTRLAVKSANKFGLVDDEKRSVRDFLLQRYLDATSDSDRAAIARTLGMHARTENGEGSRSVGDETRQVLSMLLAMKRSGTDLKQGMDGSSIDELIDAIISGKVVHTEDLDNVVRYVYPSCDIRDGRFANVQNVILGLIDSERHRLDVTTRPIAEAYERNIVSNDSRLLYLARDLIINLTVISGLKDALARANAEVDAIFYINGRNVIVDKSVYDVFMRIAEEMSQPGNEAFRDIVKTFFDYPICKIVLAEYGFVPKTEMPDPTLLQDALHKRASQQEAVQTHGLSRKTMVFEDQLLRMQGIPLEVHNIEVISAAQ